jgi:hypothetical protein
MADELAKMGSGVMWNHQKMDILRQNDDI